MAKQPYIQFYIGDYIKDTRILPLNIRGAWVDLILFMWENEPKGELTGTIEDFSRMMNCSLEEANLVIQTLKQKKIFAWEDLQDGQTRIVSRKQKKMAEISKTRKKVGELGGNPVLVNKKLTKHNNLVNQKDNLNTEYEYDTEYGKDKEVVKEEETNWPKKPGVESYGLPLPEITEGSVIQFIRLTSGNTPTKEQVESLWDIFKKQNFTGQDFYDSPQKVYSHFINWSKTQKINGTHQQQSGKYNPKTAGVTKLLASLKEDISAGRTGNPNGEVPK